jgi:hypothetical protein
VTYTPIASVRVEFGRSFDEIPSVIVTGSQFAYITAAVPTTTSVQLYVAERTGQPYSQSVFVNWLAIGPDGDYAAGTLEA